MKYYLTAFPSPEQLEADLELPQKPMLSGYVFSIPGLATLYHRELGVGWRGMFSTSLFCVYKYKVIWWGQEA